MHTDIRILTYAAIFAWLQIMIASGLRTRGDLGLAFGNRADVPEPTPLAGRGERAARNMLENLILFTAVVLAAQGAGVGGSARVILGARLFFWARVAYYPVYLAGITYLRTALWAVGVAGMAMIASKILAVG
jgi:uncharacterized MAPEG superfamily protein